MTKNEEINSLNALTVFREKVTSARRRTGHLQKELADALGIDAHVLSRKLHGTKKSFLTHTEVKHMICILAEWDAITKQDEAHQLLLLMGLKKDSFSELDWKLAPLNRLECVTDTSPSTIIAAPFHALSALPNPVTSLVGREYDIQLLLDRLRDRDVRLLTLFGMGGVGKTRLALEVASTIQQDFADGVFFLSLATLHDGALLPATIVQALHLVASKDEGNSDWQHDFLHENVLKNFLRDKQLLLVFDNVEQIPEIASFISDLLQSTQSLKIMVTSRALLHLYGESEYDVPPLAICTSEHRSSLDTFAQFSAIRLFLERAQAINPAFGLTQHNAKTISRICARLDGLPLAIELAAARSKVLPLSKILHLLMSGAGQNFLRTSAKNVLPRHQTLQETLNWSYELLDAQSQAFFRRYSVFVGGWTLDAAQAIVGCEGQEMTIDDVFEQMEFLIDQSLVKRMPCEEMSSEENGEPRFYLLETIREYARGQLEALGEQACIQQRHAHYYVALIDRTELNAAASEQSTSLALLVREQGNLRAVLDWAIEHNEAEIALHMNNALGRFWEIRMQFREAHRWIDAVFKMKADTSFAIRAQLLMGAARLALWEIGYERSRELAQEALKIYDAIGDRVGRTWALFQIGDTWHIQGDYVQASAYLEECLQLLKAQEDWRGYAFTLSRLGALATLLGNMQQARIWLDEAILSFRSSMDSGLLTVTLIYLGILAFIQNDLKLSSSYLREGLLLARQTGNHYMLATDLLAFGCVLGRMQGPFYTAHICSAAEVLYQSMNTTVPVAYRSLYATMLGRMQAQVDSATWENWWAEGQVLPLEEVCTLVISASDLKG